MAPQSGYWFQPVRTRRSFEEAVDQISHAIRSGDLSVGDRLPSEREMAAQMEISRPTVREALRILRDAGVVSIHAGPGGGAFVSSAVAPLDLLQERVDLRISEVGAVLEARRVLEPRVAQLAALYGDESDFDKMQRTIDLQLKCMHDRELTGQLDERFHLAIAQATKNPEIVELMRVLLRKLTIAWDMDYRQPLDPTRGIRAHEVTLAAILSGDYDAIEDAMDDHLSILERLWEEGTGRPRLRQIPGFLRGGRATAGQP
jgi:GntR family transcriptional regulator, transcriptional repressor for pyruvate dehydrogenase complex